MRRAGQSPKSVPEQLEAEVVIIANPRMTLELLNHDKPPDDKVSTPPLYNDAEE
jgi:hypothetical protein